jgi:hypothetical protein
VVALTVLWDAIDRGFQGRPQDGVLMTLARKFNVATQEFNSRFVANPQDGFAVNLLLLIGGIVPILFWAALWYTLNHGFSLGLCVAYHLFRLQPYFMGSALRARTLAHPRACACALRPRTSRSC